MDADFINYLPRYQIPTWEGREHFTNVHTTATSWSSGATTLTKFYRVDIVCTGAGFSNDSRETLSYGELLKNGINPILNNIGRVNYCNNYIKCLYNRAHCLLILNFFELGKICFSKVQFKIKSSVNLSRIWLLDFIFYLNAMKNFTTSCSAIITTNNIFLITISYKILSFSINNKYFHYFTYH